MRRVARSNQLRLLILGSSLVSSWCFLASTPSIFDSVSPSFPLRTCFISRFRRANTLGAASLNGRAEDGDSPNASGHATKVLSAHVSLALSLTLMLQPVTCFAQANMQGVHLQNQAETTHPISPTPNREFDRLTAKIRSNSGHYSERMLRKELRDKMREARLPEYNRYRSVNDELRDRNRLLVLEAWDIIHRGSFGYPGWYDPNGGYFVDPETFQSNARKALLQSLSAEDLSSKVAAEDVIRKMVADLHDPYSKFLSSTEYHRDAAPPSVLSNVNRLVGVGVQLFDPVDGEEDLVVVAPSPNSPAERAGIKPLDRVLQIDGLDVGGEAALTASEAMSLIRGWEGTEVKLLVKRARDPTGTIMFGDDVLGDRISRMLPQVAGDEDGYELSRDVQPELITLKRQRLNVAPVQAGVLETIASSGVAQKIGYIRINFFNLEGTKYLSEAVGRMEDAGVEGYIIDVRNCLGGIFKEALMTASMFQGEDQSSVDNDQSGKENPDSDVVLINIQDASGFIKPEKLSKQIDWIRWPENDGRPLARPVRSDKPIRILTNRGSASSSEVLALSLVGNNRAEIIGEKTFGKALIQHPYFLADGSVLKLTVAEYLSPKNQHLGSGLLPNTLCANAPELGPRDDCLRIAQEQIAQDRTFVASTITDSANAQVMRKHQLEERLAFKPKSASAIQIEQGVVWLSFV
eukprot:762781-Hanusia_phi.AAC.24